MDFVLQIILLAVGFFLLVKGADFFVDGSSAVAKKFGIPQLVIGLTIEAMGTNAPEAAVSITAALQGNAEITVGNIVGSNILNILIILGLSALITPLSVAKSTIWVDIPFMIAITILLLVLGYNGTVGALAGVLMLVIFIAYLGYLYLSAKKNKETDDIDVKDMSTVKALIMTVVGLALVVIGSKLTVDAASYLATAMGLSQRFIGLTIVALGTSLPELFTSVLAAKKGNADIAIGNIVGSNIFNILFVVGVSAVIVPVPFAAAFRFDTLIAVAAGVLLLLCSLRKRKLGRLSGILMLLGYAAYFAMIW